MHQKRDAYRAEYWKYWNGVQNKPDIILCPVGPGVAPKMDQARYWGYTSIWNLLDYPAAVFPVSQVQEKEDSSRGPMLGAEDEWNWKQCNLPS
jgi:amidase